MKKYLIVAVINLSTPILTYASSCDDYPYANGINVEDVDGGTKIISTSSAGVSFDDVSAINDARDEATLEAKAAISKFMTEGIKSDEEITKAIEETKSMQGQSKTVAQKSTVDRVKKLSNSTQALLRGVIQLGDCYTKGSEIRVSVGIKPETINQAAGIAGGISDSVSVQPNQTNSSLDSHQKGNGSSMPLQGIDGYSNTKRLNNF